MGIPSKWYTAETTHWYLGPEYVTSYAETRCMGLELRRPVMPSVFFDTMVMAALIDGELAA